jgi:hypothetical protein
MGERIIVFWGGDARFCHLCQLRHVHGCKEQAGLIFKSPSIWLATSISCIVAYYSGEGTCRKHGSKRCSFPGCNAFPDCKEWFNLTPVVRFIGIDPSGQKPMCDAIYKFLTEHFLSETLYHFPFHEIYPHISPLQDVINEYIKQYAPGKESIRTSIPALRQIIADTAPHKYQKLIYKI